MKGGKGAARGERRANRKTRNHGEVGIKLRSERVGWTGEMKNPI